MQCTYNQSHSLPVPSDFSQAFLIIHARSCHKCVNLTTQRLHLYNPFTKPRACAVPELVNRTWTKNFKVHDKFYNITFWTTHTARLTPFSKLKLKFLSDGCNIMQSRQYVLMSPRNFYVLWRQTKEFRCNIRTGPPVFINPHRRSQFS
jgi:hypothetical protein